MRVRSVSTAVVEANFDWTIVRIETEDGLVGWGESFFAPGLTAIIDQLGALLVGRDARNIAKEMSRLQWASSGAGSSGGAIVNALTGIDAALWDLNARALGIPLWQLLGGRFHDRVRAYADCHADAGLMSLGPLLELRPARWSPIGAEDRPARPITLFDAGAETERVDLEALARRARQVADLGFDALKFDVDVPGLLPAHADVHGRRPDFGLLEAMLAAVREATRGAVEIALDCHWRYDLPSALRIADACRSHGVLWLEDPLAPDNVSGLVELARRVPVPLGGGENLSRAAGFAELIEQCALTVVTPDLAKVGGVAEARRVGEMAAAKGLLVAPHNIAGPVGTAFAAHVAATMPNLAALEFHALDVPFFGDLVDAPIIEEGHVLLHDRPGIGVDVVVEEVQRWAKPGEKLFGEQPATEAVR